MFYLGIDVGGTGIKAAIVDDCGNIVEYGATNTDPKKEYKEFCKDTAELSEKIIENSKISFDDIKSVGIGFPSAVDSKNGIVICSNNININNAPFAEEFRKYIDKPVFLGNDANCAALGEFFSLKDDTINNFVAVTLGTGVGGGIIINKKLYTSTNGCAGEIGHIRLVMDGEKCSCGRDGCFEMYASATALSKMAEKKAMLNKRSLLYQSIKSNNMKANGKIVFDSAALNDETAKETIEEYIKYLGEGITDIINIFQPDYIAIGGGLSRQGEVLLKPLREYVYKRTYGFGKIPLCRIEAAKLGNEAGIIGAAFLGKE